MSGWNFADVWEVVADAGPRRAGPGPGRPARHVGASSTGGPTASPARCSTPGRSEQDKVAQYLYNGPEYLESMFAVFKAGLVPVNTNYRYADDELVYLWDNADAVAVVFHGTFADTHRADPRRRCRGSRTWLWVDDGSGPCPDWADALRGRRPPSATRARSSRAVGPQRRRPPTCSTPAAPPACRRASCGARTT